MEPANLQVNPAFQEQPHIIDPNFISAGLTDGPSLNLDGFTIIQP